LLWQPVAQSNLLLKENAKRKKNDYCINFAFCVIFSGGEFLLSPLPPKLCQQSVPLVGGETVKVRMEKKQLEFEKARKELQEAQVQLQAIQQAHEKASKDYEDAKRIADEHQKLIDEQRKTLKGGCRSGSNSKRFGNCSKLGSFGN